MPLSLDANSRLRSTAGWNLTTVSSGATLTTKRRASKQEETGECGDTQSHLPVSDAHVPCSDWEEVEGDEASALMMELDARMAGSRAQRAAADSAVAKDEEMEEESDDADDDSELLAMAAQSHISLAQNGFELRVGQRILGAREFAQFYRQRHRPADRREVALVANNARERGMVLRGGANAPAAKIKVPKQQAMDQRREQRSQAWLRMKVQMSTNGPMFRCDACTLLSCRALLTCKACFSNSVDVSQGSPRGID